MFYGDVVRPTFQVRLSACLLWGYGDGYTSSAFATTLQLSASTLGALGEHQLRAKAGFMRVNQKNIRNHLPNSSSTTSGSGLSAKNHPFLQLPGFSVSRVSRALATGLLLSLYSYFLFMAEKLKEPRFSFVISLILKRLKTLRHSIFILSNLLRRLDVSPCPWASSVNVDSIHFESMCSRYSLLLDTKIT